MVIGQDVHHARQALGWTQVELAERAGISGKTLRTIEAGAPGPAIGTVFEVALLVGLQLLGRPEDELPALVARGREVLALAPKRVRAHAGSDESGCRRRDRTRPRMCLNWEYPATVLARPQLTHS